MQKYLCHKRVEGGKIMEISSIPDKGIILKLDDGTIVNVSVVWADKHNPGLGGYFVRYEDGYESFSPAGPFEAGYTPVIESIPFEPIPPLGENKNEPTYDGPFPAMPESEKEVDPNSGS
jgi:hypothetical protein